MLTSKWRSVAMSDFSPECSTGSRRSRLSRVSETVLVDSLGGLMPWLANLIVRVGLMLLVYVSLVTINVRGVRGGSGAVYVVTVTKLLPILLFLSVGIFFINRANFSLVSISQCQAIGLIVPPASSLRVRRNRSCAHSQRRSKKPGAHRAAFRLSRAGRDHDYLPDDPNCSAGNPWSGVGNHTKVPLAEAAAIFLGNAGRITLIVGAAISAFGFVASDILSSPRMLFAIGRDGILPGWFAHVHPRYRSPDVAIITYAAVAFVLSVCSSFEQLAVLST